MAVDKAVDSAQLDGAMTATANKIREKTKTSAAITWDPTTGFASTLDTLLARKLVALSIGQPPKKTVYKAGEVFDDTGMVVVAIYSDGDSAVCSRYSIFETRPLHADDTDVTISYAENGQSVAIRQTIFVTRTSVAIPSQKGSLNYTGSVQSPTWLNYDPTYMTLSGSTSGMTAGSYSVTFTLKDTNLYQWSDGTIAAKKISWSILASCFGVCWDYSSPSTALSRLASDTDPNGWANTTIMVEPHAAVGTGSGSSPFDSYMPWKGMEEYNVVNNALRYKKGLSGFSRTENDTVVYIPEFYYKFVTDSANNKIYYYIADSQMTGFEKHPGSGRYVGKYHTGDTSDATNPWCSKSGVQPATSITRATARTQSKAKGSGWAQYDFATYSAIVLLYLVEFADWDSQSKIGHGCCTDREATGGCDAMNYHTGTSASSITEAGSVQYRNIEGLWSNVYNWVDCINISESRAICLGPESPLDYDYVSDTDDVIMTSLHLPSQSGYITKLGMANFNRPWLMVPTAAAGSSTTYVPDYVEVSTANERHVVYVGGSYYNVTNSKCGLLYFNAMSIAQYTARYIGTRLVFIPTEV